VLERATAVRRYEITNRDRTVGARLSGEIARAYRAEGMPSGSLDLHFHGAAGQSFGAFCNRGMRVTLVGEAQDYVGKSMYGGEIIMRPPAGVPFSPHGSVILGNTALYGATGGALYAAGRAGERLCVRNSGARALVEGCGDHGCEYMTGGIVAILGKTGRNFAAGMSGGLAYVLDLQDRFPQQINEEMVSFGRLASLEDDDHRLLHALVSRHQELTGSVRAAWVLEHWENLARRFWVIVPKPPKERIESAAPTPLRVDALEQLQAERRNAVAI
jgi:glutamate synthase domain-containing protein 3